MEDKSDEDFDIKIGDEYCQPSYTTSSSSTKQNISPINKYQQQISARKRFEKSVKNSKDRTEKKNIAAAQVEYARKAEAEEERRNLKPTRSKYMKYYFGSLLAVPVLSAFVYAIVFSPEEGWLTLLSLEYSCFVYYI